MSNIDASKHLWFNIFGSQNAVIEISCSVTRTFLVRYAMWDIQGGWLFAVWKVKFLFVLFITSLTLKHSTLILIPTGQAAQIVSKSDFGEYPLTCLVWGNIHHHSLWSYHTPPKSLKNCTYCLKRIFQSERWPFWEVSLKSQHLGLIGRGGCMRLWFRRS